MEEGAKVKEIDIIREIQRLTKELERKVQEAERIKVQIQRLKRIVK